jgi:lipopolysaccharide export system protein LptA
VCYLFSNVNIIVKILLLLIVCAPQYTQAQSALFTINNAPGDSLKRVDILEFTRDYRFKKLDSVANLITLAGNVRLKQGKTYFTCDSLSINTYTGIMEAFGSVHINESDTVNTYAQYLKYFSKTRKAELRKNVRISDRRTTIINEAFDYDMLAHVGTYNVPTKIIANKTNIRSGKGIFYLDTRDLYFYKDVNVTDPKYTIKTDTLLFNANTQIAQFVSPTVIRDDAKRLIKTSQGYYNAKTGKAEFGNRPYIQDGDTEIMSDIIANDEGNGTSQASGNVVFRDKKNGVTLLTGNLFQNKKKGAFLATLQPVLIIVKDKDTAIITADSLFSARISDMKLFKAAKNIPVEKDTLNGMVVVDVSKLSEKDSSNRYFEAYRNVRIYNDSLQAVGDSCFYSFVDSTFRLFGSPVAWSKENQISGDTMYVFTEKQKTKRIHVFENGFMISKLKQDYYNQIKGKTINGYFIDGNLDYMRARGSAESVYIAQDKDSAFVAFNKASSDIIDMRFANQELKKVVFINDVSGKLSPPNQVLPDDRYLRSFNWQDTRRPKSKFELFERVITIKSLDKQNEPTAPTDAPKVPPLNKNVPIKTKEV